IPLPDGAGARGIVPSADGKWAAVELTDSRLVEIDLTEKSPPVVFNGRFTGISLKGPASLTGGGRFSISPDGRWVATGFNFVSNAPMVWDGRTGELAARLNDDTSVVSFSPDGQWLGTAGMEHYSIWSAGGWNLMKSFPRDESTLTHGAMAFASPDSLLAVARTRQSVQLRDSTTDEPFCDLIPPVPQSVVTLRLALDASTLAASTPNDLVEIWRLDALRKQLAAMNLDWPGPPQDQLSALSTSGFPLKGWGMTAALSLGAFGLAAAFSLLTLRNHRAAIERFVAAEAQAAKRDRQLSQARIELLHSQKMQALGTLAVGIAHDFNNLLSVVRMSNKLIGREAEGESEIQEYVTDIEQAVLQGKHVVSSMLGYARNGQDTAASTDAATIIAEAVSLLSKEFLSGIALTLEVERDPPKAAIARGPLEQVLLNLVVNASEAMQGSGKLKIILRACPVLPDVPYVLRPANSVRYVELIVRDSGPGIAPDLRDRVFEPFFTTKDAGSKVGTGLGLSLVYTIAKENHLGLAVESEEGKGAVFRLVMPVAEVPVRQSHSSQNMQPV
ncbi:MAG TPA: ATP-binding protein, partial [Verrucomicrobiae bacterium]